MYKLFSVQEATELIPVVDRTLREMQISMRDALELRERMQNARPFSVDARNIHNELEFLLRGVHEQKAELDRMGVLVKDVEDGVVDFPSRLGAEVVYLCWSQGQDAITHYHRLNETEGTRQRLPAVDAQAADGHPVPGSGSSA